MGRDCKSRGISHKFGEGAALEPIVRTPLRAIVHQVPGVGVSRLVGEVVVALVQELTGENGQITFLHLHGHEV